MQEIKFGTDGWRAIIGDNFTVENVQRISEGVCLWMLNQQLKKVVIGYDTRFGGQLFSREAARVFAAYGIKVFYDEKFVSTPMVSFATRELGADLGVMITASHNPPSYNGYKLKGPHGGPALQDALKEIEALVPKRIKTNPVSYEAFKQKGIIEMIDLESIYLDMLGHHFNLKKLGEFGHQMVYDSMYGSGKNLMKRLFPDAVHLHFEDNPGFNGISPEPIDRNLQELEAIIKKEPGLKIGIANDGDADRIGLYDEYGKFVDSHHILLLLLYYLIKYKKQKGKVLASAAVTEKLEELAQTNGLEFEFTKIGFKHITPIMLKEDVLLAGEEAGGMAIRTHLPERDGIYISLVILELMYETGKSLANLVNTIYEMVGSFAYDRIDLKINNELKEKIVENCSLDRYKNIAGEAIIRTQKVDGYRYFLRKDKWLMIRPSGTEPVLRIYAQAANRNEVSDLLKKTVDQLLS